MEDDINEAIDKIHPYTTNPIKDKWGRTRNWDDSLQIYQTSHENGYVCHCNHLSLIPFASFAR